MRILTIRHGATGLQYHRQLVPHSHLVDSYPTEVKWMECATPEELTEDLLKDFDIVHVLREAVRSRPKKTEYLRNGSLKVSNADGEWLYNADNKFLNTVKSAGIKLVFDIDDNWQLPKGYKRIGRHGLYDSHHAFNVEKRTLNMIKSADLVTTTTGHFANYISTHTAAPVEVLPNTIDKRDPQWNRVDITSPLVRFGWIGGVHHREDIKLLQVGIGRAYREIADFQICLSFEANPEYLHHERIFSNNYNVTDDYRKYLIDQLNQVRAEQFKAFKEDRQPNRPVFVGEHYTYHQPYRRLWSKDVSAYATLYNDIDVSLVPLRSNNFNKYKSELKLVEAGAMGKAAIVTKVKPYDHFPSECVRFVDELDMNNGWIDAMKEMMDDEVRERYASNLEEYCNEYYNIDKVTKKRYEIYNKLIG